MNEEKETRTGRLENWHEVVIGRQRCMFGNVYECNTFQHGEEMITSQIVNYFHVGGVLFIETYSGSVYQLGEPARVDRTMQQIFQDAMNDGKEQVVLN